MSDYVTKETQISAQEASETIENLAQRCLMLERLLYKCKTRFCNQFDQDPIGEQIDAALAPRFAVSPRFPHLV